MNVLNEQFESRHQKSVLRFITAGSVDDGKSTLIGRLLFDSKAVYADQVAAIGRSRYNRASGDQPDFALLVDGLEAEREQGITIDVAYRYFATPARSFIVADAPGHEQYTRNMVTAASTAHAAVLLVDAAKVGGGPLLIQTRRHSTIARILGIRHIILAVNKLDLLGWDEEAFRRIERAGQDLAAELDMEDIRAVPISALNGDNVVHASDAMPWYCGPTLLQVLEGLDAPADRGLDEHAAELATDRHAPLRFPVQRVLRLAGDQAQPFRGYAGQAVSGSVSPGDTILIQPANTRATVRRILSFDGALDSAPAGVPVTLELNEDVDVMRGDVLSTPSAAAAVHRSFEADICWLDTQPLSLNRKYLLKHGTRTVRAGVEKISSVRDVSGMAERPAQATALAMNDIARVRIVAHEALPVDDYQNMPSMGSFILIDDVSHQTAAAGMIRLAAARSPTGVSCVDGP